MKNLDDWKMYISALIYPIQFESNPIQGVNRVLEFVVARGALGASPAIYLGAIQTALTSNTHLADLIPQEHSEQTIRHYLAELERHLARMV